MKSFLPLILLFAFQFVFSQSEQLKQDSTNIQNNFSKNMIVNIDKKKSSDKKSNTEKPKIAQNISIDQEINTVLNYRVNRIWREDLYCLVCMKNYNSERAA
ncbi:hypothetical protein [Chryseobacterium mulctrae]|uniref:hypothetical protein n=1 Tax=Chryseobacterium mulctrae TaxID=2576777 RepID=UPI0011171F86|nr:hypothetical protein [Chryseobacterium mulctrae]